MNPCVAHRGWSGDAPENTLAAIALAAADPDISMIEIDVQLSRDGVPVVIHDNCLDRTTNGSGRVKDFTADELRRLDAGSWFSPAFAGQIIPLLSEVLELTQGKKLLDIEIKTLPGLYPGLEEKAVELIRKFDMQDQVVLTSFDHYAVAKAKALAPEIKAGPLVSGRPLKLVEMVEELGGSVLAIDYEYLTAETARTMHERGIQVVAWTVNSLADIRAVAELHPAIQICTNYPQHWKQVCRGW
ncbi:glycerophosphodiester phosphodiesterase [Acetonema longum]|uniref:Glycerophosphoryl diester phosphodiesterase n=1 Tax=Acetonema longum DSM 6540 TaxID=1009370 RepID=F7NIB0_9FIRM|nr:glycerophosphodiester phosphodiesterase family protein [Acetonema longum]EGO64216.1 glycerophosphoryl diester phosphodiesterase [Acetonema longum DSM 6540]